MHGAVEQQFSVVLQDADVQGAGMPGDTTVKGVLSGVESPGGLLLLVNNLVFPTRSIPQWDAAGEASIIINRLHLTASSLRSSLAPASGGR